MLGLLANVHGLEMAPYQAVQNRRCMQVLVTETIRLSRSNPTSSHSDLHQAALLKDVRLAGSPGGAREANSPSHGVACPIPDQHWSV
jgi:hypothetical protein